MYLLLKERVQKNVLFKHRGEKGTFVCTRSKKRSGEKKRTFCTPGAKNLGVRKNGYIRVLPATNEGRGTGQKRSNKSQEPVRNQVENELLGQA